MIVDIVFGFLGSGKTTFIRRILHQWGESERIVVLVNEFGDVGIDGDLLSGQGGDVVEMPSGCICCTLQADFRSQLTDIINDLRPQRLVIEPTGVATIGQIRAILDAQLFEGHFERIHNIQVVDAAGFMGLYKANRHFVESQIQKAHLVLLNKRDLVETRQSALIRNAISAINPEAAVLPCEYAAVDWAEYRAALPAESSGTTRGHVITDAVHDHVETVDEHAHVHEDQDALGYQSLGFVFGDWTFDKEALERFFRRLNTANTAWGEIVRAKGIFRVPGGWSLMELAGTEFSIQPVSGTAQSKVSVIGKQLDREAIRGALEHCRM